MFNNSKTQNSSKFACINNSSKFQADTVSSRQSSNNTSIILGGVSTSKQGQQQNQLQITEPDICQQIDLNQIREIHNSNFYSKGKFNSGAPANNGQYEAVFQNLRTNDHSAERNDNEVVYEHETLNED